MAQRTRKTGGRREPDIQDISVDELPLDSGEWEHDRPNGEDRGARFWDLVEEKPLAVGAVTLGLGLLAGLVLPGTRREDELLGDTRDRLLEQARQKGRDAVDRGKEMAQGAVAVAAEGLAAAAPKRRARSTSRRRTTESASD